MVIDAIIPRIHRQRQEDHKFKAILGFKKRSCLACSDSFLPLYDQRKKEEEVGEWRETETERFTEGKMSSNYLMILWHIS